MEVGSEWREKKAKPLRLRLKSVYAALARLRHEDYSSHFPILRPLLLMEEIIVLNLVFRRRFDSIK